MKPALSILKPEVKTRYLKNVLMEKVRYVEVPDQVDLEDLKRDIKNGAVHMKELEALLEKKSDPEYIIVTAQTEEQGLLGVSYLAACFNSRAEEIVDDSDETDDFLWEEPEIPEIFPEEELIDIYDDDDEEDRWEESDRRIPIGGSRSSTVRSC